MRALTYLARRFVAGEEMSDAVEAVRRLNGNGILASLDVLGEAVTDRNEAEGAAHDYLRLLDEIACQGIAGNVSIKLSQMGLEIDTEFCFSQMHAILEKARQQENFVRIDMESSALTQSTLDVYYRLYRDHPNVGIVLQSYLYRSEKDARDLAALHAPVRVCKGAYKEPQSIAFKNMDDIRRSFRTMVEILLRGGSKVGIATHDDRLIDWAIEWTGEEKIPRDRFEFQMLYGLRRKRARELAKNGFQVRTYVPFGSHWLPYFMRRLRERKENVFFVLKGLVAD
ncbi:MAG: proline dehydrogenase family protein [Pseudomonadota bacterium]